MIRAGKWKEWRDAFHEDRLEEVDWTNYDKMYVKEESESEEDEEIPADVLTQEFHRLSQAKQKKMHRALEAEMMKAIRVDLEDFMINDFVETCWRRVSRMAEPEVQDRWFPARIARINRNGNMDLTFLDGNKEKEYNIQRQYVRKDDQQSYKRTRRLLAELSDQWRQPIVHDYETKQPRVSLSLSIR